MGENRIEKIFKQIDEATELIEHHTNEPYLDSLSIVFEWILYEELPESIHDLLQQKLKNMIQFKDIDELPKDQKRKLTELLILKGMKENTQPNHFITPETIGLFVSYLVNKFISNKEDLRIFDPVCGTGNLLLTVLSQLTTDYKAYGSDVDPTLIRLAVNNANFQEEEIEFFHQDSLRPFLLDPVDIVLADLPVGYYPDDMVAEKYELKAKEGYSYAHHLLIEQSLTYTKDGGYLFFLIPEFLFESDQAEQLKTYLHNNAHIVGVLRLPDNVFKSKKHVKSIFILQKKGKETKNPHQPLLAMLPSFTDTTAMESILAQINEWFTNYFKYKDV